MIIAVRAPSTLVVSKRGAQRMVNLRKRPAQRLSLGGERTF